MNLKLSENLRKFRQQNDITQEQLAEIMRVTPQAISRWENGSAYPDVTSLVTLAELFHVSIDELVGRSELYGSMRLNDIHSDAIKLRREGNNRTAYNLLKEVLRIYPNSDSLRSELAVTAARMEDATDEELFNAILLSGYVESSSFNRKIIATTYANHVFLALRAGKRDSAEEIVKNTGHIWESREILESELADDNEYPAALRESVRKTLAVLCTLIDESQSHRAGFPGEHIAQGVKYETADSAEEQLRKISGFMDSTCD